MTETDITFYRFQINDIDRKILELLAERLKCAREIGYIKKKEGKGVIDQDREEELLARLIDEAEDLEISPEAVRAVWKEILKASYEKQE